MSLPLQHPRGVLKTTDTRANSCCHSRQVLKAAVATIGENIKVRRFAKFVLGEGLEKRSNNFAEEVAAATGKA